MEKLSLRVDAVKAFTDSQDHSSQIIRALIGQFLSLNVDPHTFHRIQFRRVRRQAYRI